MNIGEVAAQCRVPAKTIRYYEAIGLITPLRDGNGYRNFRASHVRKLAFIGRARALGFTIEDCRALLSLWEDEGRASADVLKVAQGHLARTEARITELETMRTTLSDLVRACSGDDRTECPILRKLAEGR